MSPLPPPPPLIWCSENSDAVYGSHGNDDDSIFVMSKSSILSVFRFSFFSLSNSLRLFRIKSIDYFGRFGGVGFRWNDPFVIPDFLVYAARHIYPPCVCVVFGRQQSAQKNNLQNRKQSNFIQWIGMYFTVNRPANFTILSTERILFFCFSVFY